MKNIVKQLGIILIILIIGFSMTACPDVDDSNNGNNNNSSNPAAGISTLNLSGKVQIQGEFNEATNTVAYSEYAGSDLTFNDSENNLGVTGTVTNGNLSYSVGTPPAGELDTFDEEFVYFFSWYDDITLSKTSVKGYLLHNFNVAGGSNASISRSLASGNLGDNTFSQTEEYAGYIYVNNDITVTGTGGTDVSNSIYGPYTTTWNNLNLAFKTGWNVLHMKRTYTTTFTGTFSAPTITSVTDTVTCSLSNPNSLKWVLED